MCDWLLGLSMGDLRGNEDKNSYPSPSSVFQISSLLTLKLDKVLRVLYFRE